MIRPILLVVFAVALFQSGCTANKELIPRDQDPDELAAAILRRGQGEGPPAPPSQADTTRTERPGKALLVKCLETTGMAACVCGYLALTFLYLAAQAHSPPR